MPLSEDAISRSWLDAVQQPGVAAGIEAVYELVAKETAVRKPLCRASGRCCNFVNWGHHLYVTGVEAAYVVVKLRGLDARESLLNSESLLVRPPQPLPEGGALGAPRTVSLAQINDARARGDCPFLVDNLCGVQTIKPLGCRVYFCDETAQEWQKDLSERALGMIRALHDAHRIEYRYGEWRVMLERVVSC